MTIESTLGHFFKSEVKTSGAQEFAKGTVFVSNSSDTQIQATMKSMIPLRISLRSDSISNPDFTATCTCSVYAKGTFCKHIWALLLLVEKKYSDFLDSKKNIERAQLVINIKETAQKTKESEYKKQQYEKLKLKQKIRRENLKAEKKKTSKGTSPQLYSKEVQSALIFFSVNGFEINETSDLDFLNKSKKTLHRIFHPDKGGSHDEAVILNKHFDVLVDFLNSQIKKN